jgi:hypothetical protein
VERSGSPRKLHVLMLPSTHEPGSVYLVLVELFHSYTGCFPGGAFQLLQVPGGFVKLQPCLLVEVLCKEASCNQIACSPGSTCSGVWGTVRHGRSRMSLH